MKIKFKKLPLLSIDIVLINLAYLLAIFIKYEGFGDMDFSLDFPRYLDNAIYITIFKLGIFHYFKLHKTDWRYTNLSDFYNIITAIVLSNTAVLSFLFIRQEDLTRGIYILTTLIDLSLIGGLRYYLKSLDKKLEIKLINNPNMRKVMIIGGGEAGIKLLREIKNHEDENIKPLVIIDDDIKKHGQAIDEVPVVGGRQSILWAIGNYKIDEIIIAIPSATRKDIGEILDICKEGKCKVKILSSSDGTMTIDKIKDIDLHDLLEREAFNIDIGGLAPYINNKVVILIGGKGQKTLKLYEKIQDFAPKELLIFDTYGKSGLEIEDQLIKNKPDLVLHLIEDNEIPFMEEDLKETIRKNVFGSLKLIQAVDRANIEEFVMISYTREANPRSIMELSKLICEMIVESINIPSKTDFKIFRPDNEKQGPTSLMNYKLLLKSLEELKRLLEEGEENDIVDYLEHLLPVAEKDIGIEGNKEDRYA